LIQTVDVAGAAVVAVENEPVSFPHAEEERIFLWCCTAVLGCGLGLGCSGVDCGGHAGGVLVVMF
jgi:hypothetical protein